MSPPATMRAAVLHGKQDVRIERIPVPALGPGDVLLRTQVALTCGTDTKVFRRGYHARMIVPPALFGHESAGLVEAVGPETPGLEPGMPAVAANSAPCGACFFCREAQPNLCDDLLFWNGAYAEFTRIPARVARTNLIRLDAGVSFRRAAFVEPLACVVRGLDECGLRAGQSLAVIGVGPIGLMFVALARLRGVRVVAAGRRRLRLAKALELGADRSVQITPGADLAHHLREASPDGRGPDAIVEAVGLPETCDAALWAVRKGGVVNLFAGWPSGTRIEVDSQRLHYEELTIKSSFHHTPQAVREAYRLIAARELDPEALISGDAPLERLPDVLEQLAAGGDVLKTAILPWGASE